MILHLQFSISQVFLFLQSHVSHMHSFENAKKDNYM